MKSIIISSIVSLSLVALSSASCSGGYAQCGGKSFSGENCCISGYECTYINEWYSECKPATTSTENNNESNISIEKMKYVDSTYPRGTGIKPVYQCNNPKHWALTMDDGPTQYSDIILDLLKKYNIKATFFVCGNLYMKTSNPEWARIIKRMDDEGHIIGNHTFDHVELPKLTTDEIISEMKQIEEALYNTIGKKPAFMRLPCLNGNSNQTVMNTLESLGYNASVNCNADSMDYANGGDKEYAVQALSKQVQNANSVISLNHLLYGGATAENIIAMMTAEIEYMLAQGYEPVTMEECLGIRAYQ